MAIIDLDSHFRDGWLLDEIYQLPDPFAKFSAKRIGDVILNKNLCVLCAPAVK